MIKRIFKPLEIYILTVAFFFSVSFDRNLNLDDVEVSPFKKLLENIHLILDSFTNYEHPLGAFFDFHSWINYLGTFRKRIKAGK